MLKLSHIFGIRRLGICRRTIVHITILWCMVLSLACFAPVAVKADNGFITEVVAEGLEYPWAVEFLPDGDFLVTEKPGRLLRVSPAGDKAEIDVPVRIISQRQGGLLDVALDPDFAQNQLVYISYVGRGYGGTGTEVLRGRLVKNDLKNIQKIFSARPRGRTDVHFGSRLLFGPDGYLYITLGERYQMDMAQDLSSHHGTVVRLYPNGTVPDDNPFVDTEGALPEIYTYGHRNVQGIAHQPGTNRIWVHEHGPQGGDELNILEPGANYGWPEITYGVDYDDTIISEKTHKEGMKQPVIHWTPSIAPCGMTFYDGDKFTAWQGDILAGALVQQHIRYVDIDGTTVTAQKELLKDFARIRDVATGPDGYIYFLTDELNGRLVRLVPSAAN